MASKSYSKPPEMNIDLEHGYVATVETGKGNIVLQLNPKDAPNTVNNFVNLARDGFYDGLTFHRVEGWVIQGGCPIGNGTGGPGYKFKDEPVKGEYRTGVLAMANAGPDTNGSQFFILKQDTPLPKAYNLFGHVLEGQDVVNRVTRGERINKITIAESE